jgi:hypothetical protein
MRRQKGMMEDEFVLEKPSEGTIGIACRTFTTIGSDYTKNRWKESTHPDGMTILK